jgi:hypothetical protein
MKRTWIRWMIRVGLGIFAILAAFIVVLFVLNPPAAWLLTVMLLQPLISNSRPPAIADGHIPAEEWGHWNDGRRQLDTNRKLAAIFAEQFPNGTSEGVLTSTLRKQGFKSPPLPRGNCIPKVQPAPVGQVYYTCPEGDPSRVLQYGWGRVPCGESITVQWTTGDRGEITNISVGYSGACL